MSALTDSGRLDPTSPEAYERSAQLQGKLAEAARKIAS